LVIRNANIVTLDHERPRARSIAVKKGVIVDLGTDNDIERYIHEGTTQVIDARGRLVIPGLNDTHTHFRGIDLDYVDLRYITDPGEITRLVAARVADTKPGELIRGGRWDHELFPGAKWPTKEILDSVSPDNPVVLNRVDGHSVLVNSYVIRRSGITRDTPDPSGGQIVKDPETGEPTGIFKEAASHLLDTGGVPIERAPEEAQARRLESWEKAFEMAASLGVTTVQLAGSDSEVFEMLDHFWSRNELTLRIYLNGKLTANEDEITTYLELARRYPREEDWIRFGYLKGYIDGTLSSATALLFEPFSDDPDKTGLPQMSYEELEKRVIAADKSGFQIGIHAIGDKANHWVLNAYETAMEVNGERERRHRIEHASILTMADIPRFAHLGVIASTQAVFVRTDNLYAEKRLGRERSKGVYAWRRLLDAGAHVAFGTDYPVEPLDPREGLYAAVTRKNRKGLPESGWFPDQILDIEEAIRLYTWEPAYAEFMEDRKGMLKEDYLADLAVYDRDLLNVAPEEILEARVDYTIVGGKIVYQRPRTR
jgi:predicted amidohydrolase YtcJ